jgi:hypothetical protein
MSTFGPYETWDEAAASPLAKEVNAMRDVTRSPMPDGGVDLPSGDQIRYRHLEQACKVAGVELGAFDERILRWLAGWENETVQVIIGLISRANGGQGG